MRIVGLMTYVCLLLLLAMVPACLSFMRVCGLAMPTATTTVLALVIMAGMTIRR